MDDYRPLITLIGRHFMKEEYIFHIETVGKYLLN